MVGELVAETLVETERLCVALLVADMLRVEVQLRVPEADAEKLRVPDAEAEADKVVMPPSGGVGVAVLVEVWDVGQDFVGVVVAKAGTL